MIGDIGNKPGDSVSIRSANPGDAPDIAWAVLEALDMDTSRAREWAAECAREDSLYSWKNTLVAETDGKPVGWLVSYPGDIYGDLRIKTWNRLWKLADKDKRDFSEIPEETRPGEYYIDTIAVNPRFRGHGIGKSLINEALRKGMEEGYHNFGILVSPSKPSLQSYYAACGFNYCNSTTFFGHPYNRMTIETGGNSIWEV